MKAKIKATGEIISAIPTYSMKDRNDTTIYYTDGKLGEWTAEELDFLPEKETAVINGFIARDIDGELYLYKTKPTRVYDGPFSEFDGDVIIKIINDLFPSVTWESGPKKVRIRIEEIDE